MSSWRSIYSLLLPVFVLFALPLRGQVGSSTEREEMYKRYLSFGSMALGGVVEAHWTADGNNFWYEESRPERAFYEYDPRSRSKKPLFDVARLRDSLSPLLNHPLPKNGVPFDSISSVDPRDSTITFVVDDQEFSLQLDTYAIHPVTHSSTPDVLSKTPRLIRKGFLAGEPDVMEVLSDDKKWFAGTKDYNLYLRAADSGGPVQVLTDGIKDYEWSVDGALWSPDSSKLALSKVDNRKVMSIPIIDWLKPIEEVEFQHYTKAGGPMSQTEIEIFGMASRSAIRVNTGTQQDQSFRIVAWTPDSSELLVQKIDRALKSVQLLAANPRDGSTRLVLEESTKTFFLPNSVTNTFFVSFVDRGRSFLWYSERDGWNHLYLYSMDGTLLRTLTEGEYPVLRVVTIDENNGWVYYTAHADRARPYDTQLYRVNLKGGLAQKLTEGIGQHDSPEYLSMLGLAYGAGVQFSPSKQYFLDTYSSLDHPVITEVRSADGHLIEVLSRGDTKQLGSLKWTAPEQFIAKAADGVTDLYGVLYKPWDFDPKKQYPVIEAIYAGPQAAIVPHIYPAPTGVNAQAIAQLGYVVFMVDGRGTPDRGKAFQDVVYGNFGRNEIPDHVTALKAVAKDRSYMDMTRVGIVGRSYGGYFVVRAMLQAPDVYKVGVATAPIYDPYDTYAPSIETFLGLAENNREAYEYASNLRLAGNLKGHLLLIHGTSDVNADFSGTMKMVSALSLAGKPYDLIALPEQTHAIQGKSFVFAQSATIRYFAEHLKPE